MHKTYIGIIVLFLLSCSLDRRKPISDKSGVNALDQKIVSSNVGRSTWQKPDFVIGFLGDIEGKKIADIGAGMGFFAYRMAELGATVYALEIDENLISIMNGFKSNLRKQTADNIIPRLIPPDDPQLANGSVDAVIIVNTISFIDNIEEYLAKVKKAIKPGGALLIVDYKLIDLTIPAPPIDERISSRSVQEILNIVEFDNISIDNASLEYQYIIKANVFSQLDH